MPKIAAKYNMLKIAAQSHAKKYFSNLVLQRLQHATIMASNGGLPAIFSAELLSEIIFFQLRGKYKQN